MGIKHIHIVLIVVSVLLFMFFGFWTLKHNYNISAYGSFIIASGLVFYCIKFLRKTKAL